MTYYNGSYYLAATTWGSSFVGLTMRKASTIADLKSAPPVRIWQDSTASRCCNYWAPEFFLLNGPDGPHWYGYYSGGPAKCCEGQRMHVIESAGTDPMGPYTYKAELKDAQDGWAIDTSVLTLNGRLYLLFSAFVGEISAITNNQNIYIAPLENPWTLSGDRVLLSAPTESWERQDGNVNEGPVALQHHGETFIIYSASGCWGPNYKLGMLTLREGADPLTAGSWVKSPSPVFKGGNEVFSPGHNTFFMSPDGSENWIVYHANNSAKGSCDMNRVPRIQKFTWNSDGTPDFGSPLLPTTDIVVPSGESVATRPAPTSLP